MAQTVAAEKGCQSNGTTEVTTTSVDVFSSASETNCAKEEKKKSSGGGGGGGGGGVSEVKSSSSSSSSASSSSTSSSSSVEEEIVLTEDGGVKKRMVKEGEGEYPTEGQQVTVHYTGRLIDGTKFDSSLDRGKPFSFQLGSQQVIKGWEVGVASMRVGEKATFTIQPEYGYGEIGAGETIPKNATLSFDVELLSSEEKKKNKWEMNNEEKIQAASDAKERGNDVFKKGEYYEALSHYKEGVEMFEGVEEWPMDSQKIAEHVRVGCLLNLANCYMKTGELHECILACNRALEVDGKNLKGLYRRGVASMNFGLLEESKNDLMMALSIDPRNVELRRELEKCKKKLQIIKEKERSAFGGMFDKVGLYEDKVLPKKTFSDSEKMKGSGGEWKDEEEEEEEEVEPHLREDLLPHVFMDLQFGAEKDKIHRMEFVLYSDTVPRTAENFRALCTGEKKGLHYKNSVFHRIIVGFMAQGGDFTNGNGTGGKSIYGDRFEDERFVDRHTHRGQLSMANAGPNTNGSQFFLTFGPAQHLNGKHVVFGKVVKGMEVLNLMEGVTTDENDRPIKDVMIVDCGEILAEEVQKEERENGNEVESAEMDTEEKL